MEVKIRPAFNMEEVNEAFDLSAHIFGLTYKKAKNRKNHILQYEKITDLKDIIIATHKNKIVGMLLIVRRQNYLLGSLVKNAGITNVCVSPDHQGRGIGRGLVEAALERIYQEKYDISTVIARRAVDSFYSRFGYVGTGLFIELMINQNIRKELTNKCRVGFRNGFKSRYLEKYAKIYTKNYSSLPAAFYRPKKWWYNFEQKMKYKINKENFVNVVDKDNLIGYFIYRDNKIIEAACYHKENIKFCNNILQYMLKKNPDEILITFPMEHQIFRYYTRLNNTVKIRRVWDGGHMMRIMDKEMLRKIIVRYIDKKCCEFSKAHIKKAKDKINKIIDTYDTKIHSEAAAIILGISRNNINPVIEKIARNIQHSWSLIDEF